MGKRYYSLFILASLALILNGCTPSPPASESGKAPAVSEENSQKPAVKTEKPADTKRFKTVANARFNFLIDIPNEWKAEDRSANGDGYTIVSDNPDVDIRAYGGLTIEGIDEIQVIKGNDGRVSDFEFGNKVMGKQITRPDSEVYYVCVFPDRHINLYINYGKNRQWYESNKDTLLYMAKSLRSGTR